MGVVIGATVGLVFSVVIVWWLNRPSPEMTKPPKRTFLPPPKTPLRKQKTPLKRMPVPVAQQWNQTVQTAIESNGGGPVYKEDFDLNAALNHIDQAAQAMSLTADEIRDMKDHLRDAISELPEKPPEQDDMCPECGNMFAVTDDYVCPECRARMG